MSKQYDPRVCKYQLEIQPRNLVCSSQAGFILGLRNRPHEKTFWNKRMHQESFEHFKKGDEVYFVSEMAEKITHLEGTLLEDITTDSRVINLVNTEGQKICVGSGEKPEWNHVEAFQGFGLLFLKQDSDRVVYVVVSADENNVMLEPLLDV